MLIQIKVNAKLPSGDTTTLYTYEPNVCPLCKKAIKPRFLYAYVNNEGLTAYTVYECRACYSAFIKVISSLGATQFESAIYSEKQYSTFYLTPNPPSPIAFPGHINRVSPQFVKIYNEANAAECANLSEIAGMGYRKAVEFLIKDYLISKTEVLEEIEKIKRKPLGSCINEYIENPQLKIVAERATWLGNDETHYIRKHEDKDIEDLKRLINATVLWIGLEHTTEEAKGIPHA